MCLLILAMPVLLMAQEPTVVVAVVEGSVDAEAAKAVLREAYRRIAVPIEFQPYSASEALIKSNQGVVAAELQRIEGISDTYENLIRVPVPINIIYGAVFSTRYRFPVTGWHSLRPYSIGIVKGIIFSELNTQNMNVQVAQAYPELMAMLSDGVVDVGVMPRIQALDYMRRNRLSNINEMEGILETIFLYHYIHVSRSELVDKLIPVLKEMLNSGETRRIRDASVAALLEGK